MTSNAAKVVVTEHDFDGDAVTSKSAAVCANGETTDVIELAHSSAEAKAALASKKDVEAQIAAIDARILEIRTAEIAAFQAAIKPHVDLIEAVDEKYKVQTEPLEKAIEEKEEKLQAMMAPIVAQIQAVQMQAREAIGLKVQPLREQAAKIRADVAAGKMTEEQMTARFAALQAEANKLAAPIVEKATEETKALTERLEQTVGTLPKELEALKEKLATIESTKDDEKEPHKEQIAALQEAAQERFTTAVTPLRADAATLQTTLAESNAKLLTIAKQAEAQEAAKLLKACIDKVAKKPGTDPAPDVQSAHFASRAKTTQLMFGMFPVTSTEYEGNVTCKAGDKHEVGIEGNGMLGQLSAFAPQVGEFCQSKAAGR